MALHVHTSVQWNTVKNKENSICVLWVELEGIKPRDIHEKRIYTT